MSDFSTMRREMRYGMPAADQIIFNREYTIGYSYYFRQAKWAMEVVDKDNTIPILATKEDRLDNFRPDYRVPEMFRADNVDYTNSGFDRGHLIASADKRTTILENSETFLLSNMSPQTPTLNRQKWRILEELIREYDQRTDIFETIVVCGPIFYFDQEIKSIGNSDQNDVTIPVPHAFFKSILSEDCRGELRIWSFIFPNTEDKIVSSLESFLVPTAKVEKKSGLFLWEDLKGSAMGKLKQTVSKPDWLKGK